MKEAITPPIVKKNIDTVNKTDKPQASKIKKDKYISNKSDNGKSLDKSLYTKRTETEYKVKSVNKSRYILSASLSCKKYQNRKPHRNRC